MSEEKADYNPADKMIKLSGKAYLQVADRIVWFRNDYPEGTIETQVVSIDEDRGSAIFRARVATGQGGIAEATGSETLKDFPQGWIEKAESKAVGRALGYLGYGTAAAGFEEGNRPVDAPRDNRSTPRPSRPAPAAPAASAPQPQTDLTQLPATEKQVKFARAIAREAGIDEHELTTWTQELYGQDVDQLNRRDMSTLIEALQRRRNEVA